MYEKEPSYLNEYPIKGTQSTWTHLQTRPDPLGNVTMPYGPLLMIGNEVENQVENEVIGYRAEVVVYDPTQVKIRYIVQC